MDKMIYMDHSATTPVKKEVLQEMLPYFSEFYGNPSSVYQLSSKSKLAIDKAREQVAKGIGAKKNEIYFTGGGSESDNWAIKGIAYRNKEKGHHIITTKIEHPAVLEACKFLQEFEGFEVTYVGVDQSGMVNPKDIEKAIRPNSILISIMHANNEVGTIQPIEEISRIAHRHNIIMHTDAAQSIGKIKVDVDTLGIDLLSVAGHKFCAPKGVGALFIRRGTQIVRLMHGARHEFGLRPGTENVMEIVGLGEACRLVSDNLKSYTHQMRKMRDMLEAMIIHKIPCVRINGHVKNRLPNTSSLGFRDIKANEIMEACPHVAVSAGAACHANQIDVSHVLKAMQVPLEYAMGTIRFSVGRNTSEEDVISAVEKIGTSVIQLHKR